MSVDSFVAHMIGRGISSDLANRIESDFEDWGAIGRASPELLAEHFTPADIEQIKRAKNRKAIPRETVVRLINECEFKCCLCWDLDSDSGVVIHHIRPHGVSHQGARKRRTTVQSSYRNGIVTSN